MKQYQKEALFAARDLGYPEETMERILNADSQNEVTRAMVTARENLIKRERERLRLNEAM